MTLFPNNVIISTCPFHFRKEHFEIASASTSAVTESSTSSSVSASAGAIPPVDPYWENLFDFMPREMKQEITDYFGNKQITAATQVIGSQGDFPKNPHVIINRLQRILTQTKGELSKLSDKERQTLFAELLSVKRFIHKIDASDCTAVNWKAFAKIVDQCTNLMRLDFSGSNITFEGLETLIPVLAKKHVHHINLQDCFVSRNSFQNQDQTRFKNLESVEKVYSVKTIDLTLSIFSSEQIVPFLTAFPSVTNLHIPNLGEDELEAVTKLPLQKLDLVYPDRAVLNNFDTFLTRVNTLRELRVASAPRLTDKFCNALKKHTELTSLDIYDCDFPGPENLATVLPPLTELTRLSVSQTDMDLKTIKVIAKLKKLRSLHFSYMHMNDTFMKGLKPVLPQLTDLCLNRCDLSDKNLETIATLAAGVHKLNVEKTQLSENGMKQFLPRFQQLVSLNLNNLPVTDGVIEALPQLPSLKTCQLVGTLISDAGLQMLLAKCAKLVHLNISHSRNITDKAVFTLISTHKFKTLGVNGLGLSIETHIALEKQNLKRECIIHRSTLRTILSQKQIEEIDNTRDSLPL